MSTIDTDTNVINALAASGSEYVSLDAASYFLSNARIAGLIGDYTNSYYAFKIDSGTYHTVILTDADGGIAACAVFIQRMAGKIWQLMHATVYSEYIGRGLLSKLIGAYRRSRRIESPNILTQSSNKFWEVTLPKYGINPMIFDTHTEYIFDPSTAGITMYPQKLENGRHRYVWILNGNDQYDERNMRIGRYTIGRLCGLWYNGTEYDPGAVRGLF